MEIGFIGTGSIGTPMAANILAAGFNLVVHDAVREKAVPLLEQGALWVDSPKEMAERCDILCTCLPGPKEMEQVTLGHRGVVEGLRQGMTYVDHTTNSPLLARKVHATFREYGVEMLDAPVSGGSELAETRDILVMVGGDKATFDLCKPVLGAMAKWVQYTGDIGTGSICKITHNAAVFCTNIAMAECWTLAVKAGVEPQVILDVFREGGLGRMTNLQVRLPETYFQGNFDPRFSLNLARKDLGLATELGRAYHVPTAMVDICEQQHVAAVNRGLGNRDSAIVLTLQEEVAGIQVRLGPATLGKDGQPAPSELFEETAED